MPAINLSNRISLDIPDEDMQAIQAAIQTLQDKLVPHLVSLGTEDRRLLPKMGAKTIDFVSKALGYARAHPELKPTYVDADEFSRDLAAVGLLRTLLQPLSQITELVGDSMTLSGSEAYAAALACYQSFKTAAKLKQPGAETIASDLADRFIGRTPKREDPPSGTGVQS